jgi:uncharacterized protein YjiK
MVGVKAFQFDGFNGQSGESGNGGDPEGIVWMGGNRFAIVREQVGRIAILTLDSDTMDGDVISLSEVDEDFAVEVGSTRVNGRDDGMGNGNDGLESIAYAPLRVIFTWQKKRTGSTRMTT